MLHNDLLPDLAISTLYIVEISLRLTKAKILPKGRILDAFVRPGVIESLLLQYTFWLDYLVNS